MRVDHVDVAPLSAASLLLILTRWTMLLTAVLGLYPSGLKVGTEYLHFKHYVLTTNFPAEVRRSLRGVMAQEFSVITFKAVV